MLVAGSSYLVMGADSYTQPTAIEDTEVVMSMNTVCRGGHYQTRPGTKIMANIVGDNMQGSTFYVPSNGGTPAHMVAIDGKIFVAISPFRSYIQLNGLQFFPQSKNVSFTVCEQSTAFTSGGDFYFLAQPKTVVIIQDGITRAAYWDGVTAAHINPTPSPTTVTEEGFDGTRIGLWSVWSNNRLWVSRGNQIFASDIGNPLKFTESQYINEARAFYLSGNCTGMIETPDKQGLLAFTEKDGTLFLSSIQDRSIWLDTPDFQKTILPAQGCIAPLSLVNQYGLTWWFSPTGLQNINSARNQNISSKIEYQDLEMSYSKQNIGPDMSGVCGSCYENYLVMSVPSGDHYNRHTWVLDQSPFEGGGNAWPGFWTGWRPIQWNKAVIGGQERVFFISRDWDGGNRVWEAFLQERTDNGCAITCSLQTKQHNFGTMFRKKFNYARIYLSQLVGNVSVRWFTLPEHNSPYEIGHKEIVATTGQVYNNVAYGDSTTNHLFKPNRAQYRILTSEDMPDPSETCNVCDVTTPNRGDHDYAFGLFIMWSGQASVDAYQVTALKDNQPDRGHCEEDEVGPKSVNFDWCGDNDLFPAGNVFGETYTATATVCVNSNNSSSSNSSSSSSSSSSSATQYCATRNATSIISQADADRKAECAANFDASFLAGIFI